MVAPMRGRRERVPTRGWASQIASRAQSAVSSARLELDRRHRRREQAVSPEPVDPTEAPASVGIPLLPRSDDLLVRTADEVPPHDQLLAKRCATEQEGSPGAGQPHRLTDSAEVAD